MTTDTPFEEPETRCIGRSTAAGADPANRCGESLRIYLASVCEELCRREVAVYRPSLHEPAPHQALRASLELWPPGRDRPIQAGWHEELGWWAESDGRSSRRYLTGELIPSCPVVADFLVNSIELGSADPKLQRYRLLTDDTDLLGRLSEPRGGGLV